MEESQNECTRTKKRQHTDDSGSEESSSDEQYEEDSDVKEEGDEEESDEHHMDSDEDEKAEDEQEDKGSDGDEVSKDADDSGADDDESTSGRTKKRKITQGDLDLGSMKRTGKESKKPPTKPGIIYLSRIPPLMKPKKMNFIFGQYGEVGRIFLQQEDKNFRKMRKKNGGNKSRSYTEGWIEFKKKKIAKRIAVTFNNTRIGDRKRSRYYDDLWNIKYLPRFHWSHLMERLEYEKQVRQQRIRTEVMQAKKETNFYLKNVEQQKVIDRMKTKKGKKGKEWDFKGRNFKQWKTEEERQEDRMMLQEEIGQRSGKVTASVLGKIFKK